jgi:Arc/MetJ-type ribon-helix-helix transcriptional regulator
MTIHLPEELARFIHDAVRGGRYAREDDVICDAVFRLKQALETDAETADYPADPSHHGKPLTKQEFQRHLVEIGLLEPAPDSAAAAAAPDDLIDSQGEILSERVIRERLIEWLTEFI